MLRSEKIGSQKWNLLIGVALLSAVPGVAVAQSQVAIPAPVDATAMANPSPADTIAYWTRDRMAGATPDNELLPGGPSPPEFAPASQGTPGAGGGSLPGQSSSPEMPPGALDAMAAAQPTQAEVVSPGPHTTFEYAPRYRTYPVSTIGKLFFTTPEGNASCSAAVTTGAGGAVTARNIVWTAAHCVSDGSLIFFTNFFFCPSYDRDQGGENPAVGCWPWSFVAAPNEWHRTTHGARPPFNRDFAIIGLAPRGTIESRDVADVTGGLGFAWNLGRRQNWVHLGYPGGPPFDGRKIIWTGTQHNLDDDTYGLPATMGWGTSQTQGSSGSAVILAFSFAGGFGNFINSDISYGNDIFLPIGSEESLRLEALEAFGPYFDTRVCNFWRNFTRASLSC